MATKSKTLRLKETVINDVQILADANNRNFNNMTETLMKLGIEHYKNLNLKQ